ncbi:MAG: fumarylacetoacetate hydrolase family protein, partial [Alphaproteobacteria bacterium]|nr:fumarylacetoacetate hydrolase family protein [Alphaproteobacteria bacterium]
MRLATLENETPDGRLVLVAPDGAYCASAPAPNLQAALEDWDAFAAAACSITTFPDSLDLARVRAPLPRAWQWLDGSVYPSHGALMDKVLGVDKPPVDHPLMYQGVSDTFYGPLQDVPMASEELGIDFEGEFGIIIDRVPMGTSAVDATRHIRLLVQINDWSLRALAGPEMKTGFGWLQAKPPCSMAPFAITPDELGDAWQDSRPHLHLRVSWNGKQFGDAFGGPMAYGFNEIMAHAARTRHLVAGTVIGS